MKPAHVEVVAELPPTPLLVVASDAIEKVTALHQRANALTIRTPQDAEGASALLVEVMQLSKLIEGRRVEAKAPFLDMGKRIDAAVRPHSDALDAVARLLKPKLAQWQQDQDRIAREAEAKRLAELKRLDDERSKREKEAAEAAQRAQQAEASEFADFDVDLAQQKAAESAAAIANLASARAVVAPKPAGISYRTTLKASVLDVEKLPRAFQTILANNEAIRKAHCVGWKEGDPIPVVPGIRFEVEKTPVVNSRR